MSEVVIILARGHGADVLLPLFGFVIGGFVLGAPYWAVYLKHVRCPRCGSEMVERVASRGRNRGGTFLGCSRFPACKGSRAAPHPLGVLVTGVACGCLMILGYGFLTEEWRWLWWQAVPMLMVLWLTSVWGLNACLAPAKAASPPHPKIKKIGWVEDWLWTIRGRLEDLSGWAYGIGLVGLLVLLIVVVSVGIFEKPKQPESMPEVGIIQPIEINTHSDLLMRSYRDAELAQGLRALEDLCKELRNSGVEITASRLANLVDEKDIRKLPVMIEDLKEKGLYLRFIREAAVRVRQVYLDL